MLQIAGVWAEASYRDNYQPAFEIIDRFRLAGIGIAQLIRVHAPKGEYSSIHWTLRRKLS